MQNQELPEINILEKCGKAMLLAFSHLPMRVLYVFADIVYFFMYVVIGYRKKIVRENLQLAFPLKNEKERKEIEKRFYKHMADYFFETIKGLTISDEELRQRYVIKNTEVVSQLAAEGRHVFLYGAHIGNWEWLTSLPLYFPEVQVQTFYQPQRNRFANHISLAQRTRRGIYAVESQKGFRHMYNCTKTSPTPTLTLILGDQCPHSGAQKFWIDFMGQDTPFLVGPEHIARKLSLPLVYPSYVKYARGKYEVELRLISENTSSVEESNATKRFAAYLEEDLNRIPELWLWSHRRWKLKHEDFKE